MRLWWTVARLIVLGVALLGMAAPARIARASSAQVPPTDEQVEQQDGTNSADAQNCEDQTGTGCNVDNQNVDDQNVDDTDDGGGD